MTAFLPIAQELNKAEYDKIEKSAITLFKP